MHLWAKQQDTKASEERQKSDSSRFSQAEEQNSPWSPNPFLLPSVRWKNQQANRHAWPVSRTLPCCLLGDLSESNLGVWKLMTPSTRITTTATYFISRVWNVVSEVNISRWSMKSEDGLTFFFSDLPGEKKPPPTLSRWTCNILLESIDSCTCIDWKPFTVLWPQQV